MRKVLLTLALILGFAAGTSPVRAQPVPPAPGVEIPPSVLEAWNVKGQFEFQHAWIEKTRKLRENRERYINERGFFKSDMMPAAELPEYAVTGSFSVPVFCVKYSDSPVGDPFPIASLQTKLYTGPFAPRTLTQFYNEISYGDLNVTGTVYGWFTLPSTNAFYAGAGSCNGLGACGKVSTLISQTVTANDAAVNFGLYDNDGPDGLPNSGDDDGFADFVAFVHPERGAECGVNGNIWSHRSSVSPITTNDPRFGGGFIRVSDYVIQPILNCDNVTLIDIGVFCHEYGHAFGLPDLYDTNGGSQGVGHWCLMGSGNYNVSTSPSHMGAWSKNQLGWSNVTVVPAVPTAYDIFNVENNREIFRLDVMGERWRRLTQCALGGSYSMYCGFTGPEAALRSWTSGSGYGNSWRSTVSRDFYYNGAGSVALQYDYAFESEPSYDFTFGEVSVGATTSAFAIYHGAGSGTANIDLTPYLASNQPYTVSFRFTSDGSWSDEDGLNATTCGAFVLDDVSVVGGGENYATDFEAREDGWAETMNPPVEHFLVENRQPISSDASVWGGGGLTIWHVDTGDQTGGTTNLVPRRVAVEQADGLGHLEANTNRGDAGDPYPGSTVKMAFNGLTTPNSNGHGGPSSVAVTLNTGNGDPINATMVGGWAAPVPTTITPNNTNVTNFPVQIDGSLFAKTGDVELVRGTQTFTALSVEWVGKDRILASFDLTGAINGIYDVIVYNPGGASAVMDDAFTVTGIVTPVSGPAPLKFALMPNYPNPFNPQTTIRYQLPSRTLVELRVYDVAGALVRTLVDGVKAAGSYSLEWDGRDDKGTSVSSGVYFYRITAGEFSDVRKMTLLK